MALRGKRIVWASETDEGRKINAAPYQGGLKKEIMKNLADKALTTGGGRSPTRDFGLEAGKTMRCKAGPWG